MIASLLASIFIIYGPPSQKNEGVDFTVAENSNSNLNFKTNSTADTPTSNFLIPSVRDENLTDKLGKTYAQAIIGLNPDDPLSVNGERGLNVPSQESVNAVLQEQLSQKLSFDLFKKGDLKISNENSAVDKLTYLEKLNGLSEKNFSNLKGNFVEMLDEWALKQNNEPLKDYLLRIPKQINDILSLSVPSDLADFHLQNLNLWQKKLTAFTAMLNMNEDPIKSYLAIQELPGIVEENLTLQDFVEKQYEAL